MHSCALFSANRFPDGDRGGNDIPLRQGKNLHSLWDNLLGRSHLMKDVRRRTDQLYDRKTFNWDKASYDLTTKRWLAESYTLAKSQAYDEVILSVVRRATPQQPQEQIELSDDYLKAAGEAAKGRIVEAGVRLHFILSRKADRPLMSGKVLLAKVNRVRKRRIDETVENSLWVERPQKIDRMSSLVLHFQLKDLFAWSEARSITPDFRLIR
jgi:hypothetical protein